ncbi:shikimate dehydrogenase, partial [Pediococcus acidilactici]
RLIGYNTDGAGFMQSVQEAGISIKKKKMTLLGAGGAAKAVTVQAALDGAEEIVVYKRNNQTFAQVKETFEQLSYRTSCKI